MTDKDALAAQVFARVAGPGTIETMRRKVRYSDVAGKDELSLRPGDSRLGLLDYVRVHGQDRPRLDRGGLQGRGKMSDFCWLIEAPGHSYLQAREISNNCDFAWTKDAAKALRFCSKEQADTTMMALRQAFPELFAFALTLGDARAMEHGFLAARPPADEATVERVARALCAADDNPPDQAWPGDRTKLLWHNYVDSAHAAIAAIRPMDAETERAVALASCCEPICWCATLKPTTPIAPNCLTRTRRTVEALVETMEGKDGD